MKEFLEAWPRTPQGKDFVEGIALKMADPAILFYENEEGQLRVIALDRKVLHRTIFDLLGADSPMATMTSLKSDVFFWMASLTEDACLLLGVPCAPAKRNLS